MIDPRTTPYVVTAEHHEDPAGFATWTEASLHDREGGGVPRTRLPNIATALLDGEPSPSGGGGPRLQ